MLDKFIDAGGNFIDTANIYGKWLPEGTNISEILLGEWLQERGNRDEIIIGTKGGHPNLSSMDQPRLDREDIIQDLNESLDSLKTDYIDIYWLHRDDENKPVSEILDILNEQVEKGKIRYFCCSNWSVDRIKKAQNYAQEQDLESFVANQMRWSLAEPNLEAIEDETLVAMNDQCYKYHQENNFTAIPYSSQAKGFFTKLHQYQGNVDKLNQNLKEVYGNEKNLKRYQRLVELSNYLSRSVSEIVLGYLISQPFPVIPITGFSKESQLEDSIRGADLILNQQALNYLEQGEK